MIVRSEMMEPNQLVHINLKWSMLNRLAELQERKRFDNRTATINYLLDIALRMIDKIEGTPKDKLHNELEEVDQQLKHGGLVDYATKLSGKELRLIYEIIGDEYKTRGMK
jgi:hypothetical protein